jgi:hypothetical protein
MRYRGTESALMIVKPEQHEFESEEMRTEKRLYGNTSRSSGLRYQIGIY